MSVGEFTASTIAMDMDDKEKGKAGIVDMAKLTSDIAAQKELASKARRI
jgi:26S proteasome regulatory subunit N5